eukprot:762852-Hanusia_phi.AAC.4
MVREHHAGELKQLGEAHADVGLGDLVKGALSVERSLLSTAEEAKDHLKGRLHRQVRGDRMQTLSLLHSRWQDAAIIQRSHLELVADRALLPFSNHFLLEHGEPLTLPEIFCTVCTPESCQKSVHSLGRCSRGGPVSF